MTATETFLPADAVEIAVVERSGFVESRHVGAGVVLSPDGTPLASFGDVDSPVFVRSCLKPLQAIATMRLGAPLAGPAAVLATASHRAQQEHIDVVEQMLASVGLGEHALRCPSVAPAHSETRMSRRAAGNEISALHFNCSGKHAAFLIAARLGDHDLESYLNPNHPVQREVDAVVREYAGVPADAIGVDGCGAPVYGLPITALARAIGRVSSRSTDEATRLMDAVLADPWGIEGHGRPNTVTIERLGVFAKFGAEGVMVMGTQDGHSVAVKCLDGSSRATTLVALELLMAADVVDVREALGVLSDLEEPVTGGIGQDGKPAVVGQIRAGSGIQDVLASLRRTAEKR